MRLQRFRKLTGKIELVTGMHIGGSQDATQIGGMDSPVIRLPKDNMPYIPGSSLKGKMRSLLELRLGKVEDNGSPHRFKKDKCASQAEPCPICHIFGTSASDREAFLGPGRLVVRDCQVDADDEMVKRLMRESRGFPLSEEKTEISINRIKSSVEGSLRKTERVPAGVVFNMELLYRVFDNDEDGGKRDEGLFDYVLQALSLVQMECLGGNGSRGYGRVQFKELMLDGEAIELPEV